MADIPIMVDTRIMINKNNLPDVVDFHSHILPRADHGSSSTEESLKQLQLAMRYGVKRVVATPHFYPNSDSVSRFIERRESSFKKLIETIHSDGNPTIALGAEVLMCENIEKMPGIEKLCIGNSNILLLELPEGEYSFDCSRSVRALINDGFKIVLAHADRYAADCIDRLTNVGAQIQLNASSLSGFTVRRHVLNWITQNRVVSIGSDIHGTRGGEYRRFRSACKRIVNLNSDIIEHSNTFWEEIVK